jgi:hypothetical protein
VKVTVTVPRIAWDRFEIEVGEGDGHTAIPLLREQLLLGIAKPTAEGDLSYDFKEAVVEEAE